MSSSESADPILSVRGLEKHYRVDPGLLGNPDRVVRAVDGVSFDLGPTETFGIVGESGCGKSTTASLLAGLESPTSGEICFRGEDVTAFDGDRRRRYLREVQVLFQDPESSFNPRMTVGEAVSEPLLAHGIDDERRRREIVADLVDRVGISEGSLDRYPHEFSGGQKQRLALARALAVNPSVLIADEPVSALDVSVQSEILALLDRLQSELDLAVVLISHDLDVVRQICDRIAVMYLGEIVEIGPADVVFEEPAHPYTQALIASVPTPDPYDSGLDIRLRGSVPDASDPPAGCRFHPRCPAVIPPAELDLPDEEYLGAFAFRHAVDRGRLDPEDVAAIVVEHADVDPELIDAGTLQDVEDDVIARALRSAHDLPVELSDPEAERAVSDAIDAVARDGQEAARRPLDRLFESVCERAEPSLETRGDVTVACLRYERDGVEDADRVVGDTRR